MYNTDRQVVEWLSREIDRVPGGILNALAEPCYGAALLPPAVVLLGALDPSRRRKR